MFCQAEDSLNSSLFFRANCLRACSAPGSSICCLCLEATEGEVKNSLKIPSPVGRATPSRAVAFARQFAAFSICITIHWRLEELGGCALPFSCMAARPDPRHSQGRLALKLSFCASRAPLRHVTKAQFLGTGGERERKTRSLERNE